MLDDAAGAGQREHSAQADVLTGGTYHDLALAGFNGKLPAVTVVGKLAGV